MFGMEVEKLIVVFYWICRIQVGIRPYMYHDCTIDFTHTQHNHYHQHTNPKMYKYKQITVSFVSPTFFWSVIHPAPVDINCLSFTDHLIVVQLNPFFFYLNLIVRTLFRFFVVFFFLSFNGSVIETLSQWTHCRPCSI